MAQSALAMVIDELTPKPTILQEYLKVKPTEIAKHWSFESELYRIRKIRSGQIKVNIARSIEELNPKRDYPRNIVTDTIIGLTLALTTTINASRLKPNVKEINYAYYGR